MIIIETKLMKYNLYKTLDTKIFPKLERQIQQLLNYQLLPQSEVSTLCLKASEIISEEPNVVKVNAPVTVCGDTHGQFPDLLEIFDIAGSCPDVNFVFMGDYVDRGFFSVENVLCLVALKVRYPHRMTLLRGNHESRQITQVYGFYDEVLKKYGSAEIWHIVMEMFDKLPIASVIDNEILCIHGGLSPDLVTIKSLENLNRFGDIPNDGLIADLVWSDPDDRIGWGPSPRGAGYTFGADVSREFNTTNGLKLTARAHQLVMDGYKKTHMGEVVTLFSAPNYCMRIGNKGGFMSVDSKLTTEFITFENNPDDRGVVVSIRPPDFLL